MMGFDPIAVRNTSWHLVERAGLRKNPDLPLLESNLELQPTEAIANRLLCMTAVTSYAFGLPLASAEAWLEQEKIRGALSSRERAFLSGKEHLFFGQSEVQGVYALAWCTSVVETFSANERMPDDLVTRLPDLRTLESSTAFRSRLILRPRAEVLTKLDETYCFHWAWRDAHLSSNRNRKPNNMMLVAERRKALEWAFVGGDWDQIPLDT